MSVPIGDSQQSRWVTFIQFPVTRIVLFALVTVILMIPPAVIFTLAGLIRIDDRNSIIYWGEWAQVFGALAALLILARFVDRRPFGAYGFGGRTAALKETMVGFLIGAGCMSAVFGFLVACGWCSVGQVMHGPEAGAAFRKAVLFFFLVAVFEETSFRGYLFQTLELRWGTAVALVSSMVLFGLVHLGNPVEGATFGQKLLGALCISVEAGILLAAAYLLTRRLWMPIGLHWAWNLFQGPVYGAHVSGIDFGSSLLVTNIHGPAWATGGPFGPEAGAPALVIGTLVGVMLLRMAIRNGQWNNTGTAAKIAAPEFEEAWPPKPQP